MLLQEALGVGKDERLQFLLLGRRAVGLQSEGLDARLAFRAMLPPRLRALVAPDVDVLRGEELYDLGQYVVDELERGVVAGAQHFVAHAPLRPHVVGSARAAQLGIGG